MPPVNMSSILSKVEAWTKTAEGKGRMEECIQTYQRNGVSKTAAGSQIVTEKDMQTAAAKLIDVLQRTAQSCDLPASVMAHFSALTASNVYANPDGSAVINISFGGDLHRDSLRPETYDGVQNIVALLNNGYHARDYVYGNWKDHSALTTGASQFDDRSESTSVYIRSRKDREGLGFIQQAVQAFNAEYGAKYNVTAVAGSDYAGV